MLQNRTFSFRPHCYPSPTFLLSTIPGSHCALTHNGSKCPISASKTTERMIDKGTVFHVTHRNTTTTTTKQKLTKSAVEGRNSHLPPPPLDLGNTAVHMKKRVQFRKSCTNEKRKPGAIFEIRDLLFYWLHTTPIAPPFSSQSRSLHDLIGQKDIQFL